MMMLCAHHSYALDFICIIKINALSQSSICWVDLDKLRVLVLEDNETAVDILNPVITIAQFIPMQGKSAPQLL